MAARPHLLTLSVEEFFHAEALSARVGETHWRRFTPRVITNTRRALDLIESHGATATCFVLGWIAERHPALVREIIERGHEVASHGFHPWTLDDMTPETLREDVRLARRALEEAGGRAVLGHRVPRGRLRPEQSWALDVLADEGFVYDASLEPDARMLRKARQRRFPHRVGDGEDALWEFPFTRFGSRHLLVSHAGGNWLRQLPRPLVRWMFKDWDRRYAAPFMLYAHVWELDPEVPRIDRAGPVERMKAYRGLERMVPELTYALETYPLESIASYLQREGVDVAGRQESLETVSHGSVTSTTSPVNERAGEMQSGGRRDVTIVVPCFREEDSVAFLANALRELEERLAGRCQFHYVFVDDGSDDDTWGALGRAFASWPRARRVQHDRNRGVAQAVLTGLEAADTELVATMDSDCTYDPQQLGDLLDRWGDEVAVVTASPYHPDGEVVGVPTWRLGLSRTLSLMYGRVFRQRLHTYTSCFRLQRKSAFEGFRLRNPGFLGIAEMLAHVDRSGGTILECPARLESRLLGQSKMKTLRTIRQHLGLWTWLATHKPAPLPEKERTDWMKARSESGPEREPRQR